MTTRDRFEIVAPLPSPKRHLHIAVDRGAHPPRAVVLALFPRTLSNDPDRLGRLSAEMEKAALLFHPNVLAPVGIGEVGEDLAAVTVWREAVTLREILDAGGRLPSDIAARIAADVCAGLDHAHGRPEPVVHGLLQPAAVLVDENGCSMVAGFGMPGGSSVPDDLLGVGDLLHECLAGELPEDPSAPLAGVPESVAAVVRRARAVDPSARLPTADALGAAIAQAVPLASREAVAAYVGAISPDDGLRAERRRKIAAALSATLAAPAEELSEHDIVGLATPLPSDLAAPVVVPAAAPVVVPAAAPVVVPAAAPSRDGTLGGAEPSRGRPAEPGPQSIPSPAPPTSISPISTSPAVSTSPRTATKDATATDHHPTPVLHERVAGRGPRVSLWVAIVMCLGGVAVGFALARLVPGGGFAGAPWWPAPAARAPAGPGAPANKGTPSQVAPAASAVPIEAPPEAPALSGSRPAAEKKRDRVRRADAPARAMKSGMGLLDVSAPEGAEIWLDGRRIGVGRLRRQIREGNHRMEVRHRGASVGESFHLAPGETFTYAVTPR